MTINELSKYITVKKIPNKYNDEKIRYKIDGDKEIEKHHIYKDKHDIYLNETDFSLIEQKFIEKIIELSNKNDEKILKKFSINLIEYVKEHREGWNEILNYLPRLLMAKLNNARNYLLNNGRYGFPDNILISSEMYYKYDYHYHAKDTLNMNVLFSDNIGDNIYMWKKTKLNQTGLVFFYTDKKYCFREVGAFSERQFIVNNIIDYDLRKMKLLRIINKE